MQDLHHQQQVSWPDLKASCRAKTGMGILATSELEDALCARRPPCARSSPTVAHGLCGVRKHGLGMQVGGLEALCVEIGRLLGG